MKKNSVKNHRLNAQVQRDLSEIIRSLSDPGVSPMTTVTRVEITPDLKFGKVYISVIGSEEDLDETMAGIKRAAGYIRREPPHHSGADVRPGPFDRRGDPDGRENRRGPGGGRSGGRGRAAGSG